MSRASIFEMLIRRSRRNDDSSSSDWSDSSTSDWSDSGSESQSGGIPTDYVFYAPLADYAANADETGRPLTHSGTYQNLTVDGIRCVSFNGTGIYTDDYTGLPTGKNPWTQSIWAYVTSWGNNALFAFGATTGASYQSIHLQKRSTTGQINGGGWYLDYTISQTFETGRWYHLCQTYDGTSFRCYVDGVLTNTVANSNVNVGSGRVGIGRQPNTYEPLYNTYLAAARIYDRVLTDDEILALSMEFREPPEPDTSDSASESESTSPSPSGNTIRFAAGVDTTLYLTNADGVFTASPSGDWGGTGYHNGISSSWVSFYPKHGVKYSLDGGSTWLDWCFEDTNSVLDLSSVGTTIAAVTKVSGRDTVSLSGQQITINDPSSSSGIYEFDVEMS